jgi:hypothetical protein
MKFQEGPDAFPVGTVPQFPNDKKKQFASQREQKQNAKGAIKSDGTFCNHDWAPHTTTNVV